MNKPSPEILARLYYFQAVLNDLFDEEFRGFVTTKITTYIIDNTHNELNNYISELENTTKIPIKYYEYPINNKLNNTIIAKLYLFLAMLKDLNSHNEFKLYFQQIQRFNFSFGIEEMSRFLRENKI